MDGKKVVSTGLVHSERFITWKWKFKGSGWKKVVSKTGLVFSERFIIIT